jgi:hypothetical protein
MRHALDVLVVTLLSHRAVVEDWICEAGLLVATPTCGFPAPRAPGAAKLCAGAAAAAAGGSGAGLLPASGGFGLLGVVAAAPCLLLLVAVAATGRGSSPGHIRQSVFGRSSVS